MNIVKVITLCLLLGFTLLTASQAQTGLSAKDIVEKADDKMRGESSKAEMTMTIVRPDWSREMSLKSWSKGDDYSLILVTAPARDKGIAFLKREKEMWNWQPTIDRSIKMPPSMMMQSWMGSDFKNDDLVRQSSIVTDYEHQIVGSETIEGRDSWIIELTPKEDAPVVWGKVKMWISKEAFLQLKTEFYDEDGYLINTMLGQNVKEMGGKIIPAKLVVMPAEEEGHQTIIEYKDLQFGTDISISFFSVQNMKRVR